MLRMLLPLLAMAMALTACPRPKPEAAPDYDAVRRRAEEAHQAPELKPQ